RVVRRVDDHVLHAARQRDALRREGDVFVARVQLDERAEEAADVRADPEVRDLPRIDPYAHRVPPRRRDAAGPAAETAAFRGDVAPPLRSAGVPPADQAASRRL